MRNSDDELNRLKKLRDQQIEARDPTQKQWRIQKQISTRYNARQKFHIKELWTEIPHKWRGLFVGLLLGLLIWLFLAIALPSKTWVDAIGFGAVGIFAVIGVIFGTAFDLRDNLRDF